MAPAVSTVIDESAQLVELFALRDLAGEAAAIVLVEDALDLDAELFAIQRIVEKTISRLDTLQALDDPDPVLEWEELETTIEPDAWQSTPRSRQLPGVADVSFASNIELRRVLRELIHAPDAQTRLEAGESARRKVRRAIRATLEAAREGGVDVLGGEHQGHHQVADLASGLSVRRLYARFRRSLRRPVDESPAAILDAIRYAGGALATLVTSTDYADVRAADRIVLRQLRERALAWARHDRGVGTGLQLIEDLWTSADLLRGINQRQELQSHDRELVAQLSRGPTDEVRAWFDALEPLFGTDDRLDAVLDAARSAHAGPLEHFVPEALSCLARARL